MSTPGASSRSSLMRSEGVSERHAHDEDRDVKKAPSIRFHFLDWMRILMVVLVVYAHTSASGVTLQGGFDQVWLIDARTLFYDKSYREFMGINISDEAFAAQDFNWTDSSHHPRGPSPYSIRWASFARQWAIPLLFWISGASFACSYKGGMPRGIDKLLIVTLIGLFSNGVLWFVSPRDSSCIPGQLVEACVGKGLLFDFSISGRAGWWFAILFQMWYTVILMIFQFINLPLAMVLQGSGKFGALAAHYVVTILLFAAFVLPKAGESVSEPYWVLLQLGLLEAVFTGLIAFDGPLLGRQVNMDTYLPPALREHALRLVHYLMAFIALMQFGFIQFAAGSIDSLGTAYFSYIFVGFLKIFQLGFVMIKAQQGPDGDRAKPVCSKVWPIFIWVMTICMPSSNWHSSGMLTYPYDIDRVDRMDYIAGTLLIIFFADRISRKVESMPMPDILTYAGLFVYVFHPWIVTTFIANGIWSTTWVTTNTMIIAICVVFTLTTAQQLLSRDRKGSTTASDSSDNEDGP